MGVQILIAALAGLSAQSDAFFVAYTIPVFFATIFTSSKQVLVSTFSKMLETQGAQTAHQFFNIILSLGLLAFSAISVLSYLLTPLVVRLLAPGVDLETHLLAIDLLRIVGWTPLFLGLSMVGGAMLNASHHFVVDASGNLIRFSVPIMACLAFPAAGVYSISVGLLVGAVLHLLVVMLACYQQLGFRYHPDYNYRHSGVIETGRLIWVVVQGALIGQGIPISNSLFASFLPTGSIALIKYGNRLTVPVGLLFFGSVVTATMPTLAGSIARGDQGETNHIFRLSWRLISLISLPLVALLLGLNYPLVSLLFGWTASGSLVMEKVVLLSLVYSLSLLFYGYIALQNAYFYAANHKKRILQMFTVLTVVDVLLKGALVSFVGPFAFAISFLISHALTVVIGVYFITRAQKILSSDLIQFDLGLILTTLAIGAGSYGIATRISAFWSSGLVADILSIAGGVGVAAGIVGLYVVFWCKGDLRRLRYILQ